MNIKLNSLQITEYDDLDKRKCRFIKDISNDQNVCNYVSRSMDEWLQESMNTDKVLVGPAYILADKRKLVGFIRLARLDEIGLLDLHYGVHPDYRHQGYGSKILLELSDYLFKNMNSIKIIKLDIKSTNKGSIKCAENAKFKLDYKINSKQDGEVCVYTKKR